VPFDCRYRREHGPEICFTGCAAGEVTRTFRCERIERPGDTPERDDYVVDIALLDMHHGWPNLGHDALVHVIENQVCDLRELLLARGMAVRVLSYDVRRGLAIPEPPGGRHHVYVGTGGPGHLDPRANDGRSDGSQGVDEDPRWEPLVFGLFDAIEADPTASLFGVCHTFGVMCRWLGVADAVIRPPSKGGKSAGIVENVLTADAQDHPWFAQFAVRLPDRWHFRVLDSRLFDLLPCASFGGVVPLARESLGHGGGEGDALTMIEVSRDAEIPVPRILGVNHHPEIVNRDRQLTLLRKKRERGEVSDDWYAERLRTLQQPVEDEAGDRLLHLTSSFTLLGPLRAQVYRAITRRAEELGVPLDVDWKSLPLVYDPEADRPLSFE
jgi:hypothetical protein